MMKKMANRKTIVMAALLLFICIAGVAPADAAVITVQVDGSTISFPDQQPYVDENNRTLVPIRFPMEAMGVIVSWNGGTQQATLSKDGTTAIFTVGSESYTVNGEDKTMDTRPVLKNDRTVFPIRFAAEAFGATVTWDGTSNTVLISTGGSAPATKHKVKFLADPDGKTWGELAAGDCEAYYFICTNHPEIHLINGFDFKYNFFEFDRTTVSYNSFVIYKDDAVPWVNFGLKPYPNFTPAEGVSLNFDLYAEGPNGTRGAKVDSLTWVLGEHGIH